jgi:hypothetical protein
MPDVRVSFRELALAEALPDAADGGDELPLKAAEADAATLSNALLMAARVGLVANASAADAASGVRSAEDAAAAAAEGRMVRADGSSCDRSAEGGVDRARA